MRHTSTPAAARNCAPPLLRARPPQESDPLFRCFGNPSCAPASANVCMTADFDGLEPSIPGNSGARSPSSGNCLRTSAIWLVRLQAGHMRLSMQPGLLELTSDAHSCDLSSPNADVSDFDTCRRSCGFPSGERLTSFNEMLESSTSRRSHQHPITIILALRIGP